MDKHDRPYKCTAEGCEKLPGFTYSGGLLRHEREVHGKHGGPKNPLNCPHATCKRHSGKGFSRQENLNEHMRRVHTNASEVAQLTAAAAAAAINAATAPVIDRPASVATAAVVDDSNDAADDSIKLPISPSHAMARSPVLALPVVPMVQSSKRKRGASGAVSAALAAPNSNNNGGGGIDGSAEDVDELRREMKRVKSENDALRRQVATLQEAIRIRDSALLAST